MLARGARQKWFIFPILIRTLIGGALTPAGDALFNGSNTASGTHGLEMIMAAATSKAHPKP